MTTHRQFGCIGATGRPFRGEKVRVNRNVRQPRSSYLEVCQQGRVVDDVAKDRESAVEQVGSGRCQLGLLHGARVASQQELAHVKSCAGVRDGVEGSQSPMQS